MNNKKNILIISLEPFSKSGTNGRATGSLFELIFDKVNLMQIFYKDQEPNYLDIDYLFINEKNVIKSIYKMCLPYEHVKYIDQSFLTNNKQSKVTKTPFKQLIRSMIWDWSLIFYKKIYKECCLFNPDYIFVQDADIPALYKLTNTIAKMTDSEIVFYTTENYALKKNNYMNLYNKNDLFYKIFHKKLFRSQKKFINKCGKYIFLTDSLKNEYINSYKLSPSKCYVIKPYSNCKQAINKIEHVDSFIYAGNLGVGRLDTLINLVKLFSVAGFSKTINVYAKLNSTQLSLINDNAQINYCGFVNKEVLDERILNSSVLILVESFDPLISDDCCHAFSGKIAEYLSFNKIILYYGPKNATSDFLSKNNCAFVCHSEEDLYKFIENIKNTELINEILYNVNKTYTKYFSREANMSIFKKIFEIE